MRALLVSNDPALIGTWHLSSVNGQSLPPGVFLTWVFSADTITATSDLDCVSVGEYRTSDGVLTVISEISEVGSQCDPDDFEEESVTYSIANDELTVIATDEELDPSTATFVFNRGG
jgi:hypothetical protein